MFIAHAPAGYLLSRYLASRISGTPNQTRSLLWLGIFASIVPDLDLFYFYLLDNRQHSHHSYWTHTPIYWLGIFALCYLSSAALKLQKLFPIQVVFFSNIFLHLLLDSVVGDIRWFYPFSNNSYSLFTVPAQYDWWVKNFICHWTFIIELTIFALALTKIYQRPDTLPAIGNPPRR